MSAAEEREILCRARAGDASALRQIIESHEQVVAATVAGLLGNAPEVDDIGQDTFIRFFKAIESFRGESRIGTYLVRIAINLSLNELRRRQRDHRAVLAVPGSADGNKGHNSEGRAADAKALVRQALGRLEPRFRQVIVLRLIDGFSVRETAAILRLPRGTILSRLSRGLEKLRAILVALTEIEGKSEERRDS